MERQIWADFNDIDRSGHTTTLSKFAEPGAVIELGARVLAGDDEGNECWGVVERVGDDGSVLLVLDLATFRAPEDVTQEVGGQR